MIVATSVVSCQRPPERDLLRRGRKEIWGCRVRAMNQLPTHRDFLTRKDSFVNYAQTTETALRTPNPAKLDSD